MLNGVAQSPAHVIHHNRGRSVSRRDTHRGHLAVHVSALRIQLPHPPLDVSGQQGTSTAAGGSADQFFQGGFQVDHRVAGQQFADSGLHGRSPAQRQDTGNVQSSLNRPHFVGAEGSLSLVGKNIGDAAPMFRLDQGITVRMVASQTASQFTSNAAFARGRHPDEDNRRRQVDASLPSFRSLDGTVLLHLRAHRPIRSST